MVKVKRWTIQKSGVIDVKGTTVTKVCQSTLINFPHDGVLEWNLSLDSRFGERYPARSLWHLRRTSVLHSAVNISVVLRVLLRSFVGDIFGWKLLPSSSWNNHWPFWACNPVLRDHFPAVLETVPIIRYSAQSQNNAKNGRGKIPRWRQIRTQNEAIYLMRKKGILSIIGSQKGSIMHNTDLVPPNPKNS